VEANLAGPAGLAVAQDPAGGVTLYIADYYNGLVRAVGSDGIIRNVSTETRNFFGAPTRVAFDPKSRWLYVADASTDELKAIIIPKPSPTARRFVPRVTTPPKSGN